jgi:hypothetical protein
MEEQAKAPAVTPLTVEQRAALVRLAQAATPGPWHTGGWGTVYNHPERQYGKIQVSESSGLNCAANSAYIAAANPAVLLAYEAALAAAESTAAGLREENEKLREQAVTWVPVSQGYPDQFEVCLLAGNLGPDMLHGINTFRRTYRHNPELRVWELHGRAERQVPESAVHYYALLPESPSESAPSACPGDCTACEKGKEVAHG